jgi:protein tyrosine/serine phosphatase
MWSGVCLTFVMLRRSLQIAFAASLLSAVVGCTASVSSDDTGGTQEAADTSAHAPAAASSLANFVEVRPGLYRGGHPDAAGLDYLKSLGVKRIVNLEVGDFIEAFPWDISKEESQAHDRGLTELRYPMSAFEPAASDRFDKNIDEIMAILKTATKDDAIYVHCKHGQDRTGLVMGIDRVENMHWAPKDAHDEMVRIGFHTAFAGLEEYFERKTNWHE